MEPNTTTYQSMYNGSITIFDSTSRTPVSDYDPTYYSGEIGYKITGTHKLAQDKPTVTIIIPVNRFLPDDCDSKKGTPMKRLKYYLLQMENNTTTYKEMYDGKMEVIFPSTAWDGHCMDPEQQYSSLYWHGEQSCEISPTHKLAQDKPTVTWSIPIEKLGFSDTSNAAADFCLRAFTPYINTLNEALYNQSRPDNENGKYYLHQPGGEVLSRNTAFFALCPQKDYVNGNGTSVYLLEDGISRPPRMCLCFRLQVQLPRRKIRKAVQMLCRDLPDAVDMFLAEFDTTKLNEVLELSEKQKAIRHYLKTSPYCSFIANGSILPRLKDTDLPMPDAVPFCSVPEDEIEICGVKGMGIKRGITVITGGGYSGKSTLLDAIAAGIYDHHLGDGRELCITDETAVTISAEDGRSIKNVNISPFIKWLPNGDTDNFSTEHASGSTSQATNIMEAIDNGSKLLLIDEDKSATNFMIRDKMMKELIEKEPITPFTDRVNELYLNCNVSTILVIGGSGEYLSVADKIYMMDDYIIHDVTEKAKSICLSHSVKAASINTANWTQNRKLTSKNFTSYPEGCGTERLIVSDMGFIMIGDEAVDIRGLQNIVSSHQLDTIGYMLRYIEINNKDTVVDINAKIDNLYESIDKNGLDFVYTGFFTTTERFLDLPRKIEVKSVINRMRKIVFKA